MQARLAGSSDRIALILAAPFIWSPMPESGHFF
jgi:hypothetical protein